MAGKTGGKTCISKIDICSLERIVKQNVSTVMGGGGPAGVDVCRTGVQLLNSLCEGLLKQRQMG